MVVLELNTLYVMPVSVIVVDASVSRCGMVPLSALWFDASASVVV